ncbi:MAG: exo-alpha-sialidase [Candidatus Lokiarchaeota archaeon]|nr:exo-alpha-sialidase [Candidatus Lokiarchaeota archaeon]
MKIKNTQILILLFLSLSGIGILSINLMQKYNIADKNLNTIEFNSIDYNNITIISDGYNGTIWNNQNSYYPASVIDTQGNIHVVWQDHTDGLWGTDEEIMYANYTEVNGWSNATVISDGYQGFYWNDDYSWEPDIYVDINGTIHVVWYDDTDGVWGSNEVIMYVSNNGTGWSNVTIISEGYQGFYWNDALNHEPCITGDADGNLYVLWTYADVEALPQVLALMCANYTKPYGWSNVSIVDDDTFPTQQKVAVDNNGILHAVWMSYPPGLLFSISYANYSQENGWSNSIIISSDFDDHSRYPDIAIDSDNNIHVVWADETDGIWGTDMEIIYIKHIEGIGWSDAMVISDGYNGVYDNTGDSIIPSISVDTRGTVHVVWEDDTEGIWGGGPSDSEIMYADYNEGYSWSKPIVISDGYNGNYWNDKESSYTVISTDLNNTVHIIWQDSTEGIWGVDKEIMYKKLLPDKAPPILDLSSDFSYREGETGNFIYWQANDMHPAIYSISRNGSNIESDFWRNMELNSINIDGLTAGLYIYRFNISDQFGYYNIDTITITVLTKPTSTIPFSNSWIFISIISLIGIAIYVKKKKL